MKAAEIELHNKLMASVCRSAFLLISAVARTGMWATSSQAVPSSSLSSSSPLIPPQETRTHGRKAVLLLPGTLQTSWAPLCTARSSQT